MEARSQSAQLTPTHVFATMHVHLGDLLFGKYTHTASTWTFKGVVAAVYCFNGCPPFSVCRCAEFCVAYSTPFHKERTAILLRDDLHRTWQVARHAGSNT